VYEDVATAHFLKEDQLRAMIEKLDKLKWRFSTFYNRKTDIAYPISSLNYPFG
jgi:hypothetical protein